MAPPVYRQVRLKSRPSSIPRAENFEIAEAAIPDLADRQFLVRNEFLSVEPAMRGWVSAVVTIRPRSASAKSCVRLPPVPSRIVRARLPNFIAVKISGSGLSASSPSDY
jgi:oxidoreductase family protein